MSKKTVKFNVKKEKLGVGKSLISVEKDGDHYKFTAKKDCHLQFGDGKIIDLESGEVIWIHELYEALNNEN